MRLLQCCKCPAEAKFKSAKEALSAGWIWAMDSPFGRIGDDACPIHKPEALQ